MKQRLLALSMTLAATACTLQAQQPMPDMPGMKMDPPAKAKQAPPRATHPKQPSVPAAGDMRNMGHEHGDVPAEPASTDQTISAPQQAGQAQGKQGPASDASSITLPIQVLQEPEAIGFRTGTDLPAPELLRDVVDREPMTVESFLDIAGKSNPTLMEAQRDIDRSSQQAKQAGLPPNPTVGYSGEHIRGGEYHGGEQGAFFSQEFVLGRKLALRREIYRAEGRSNEFALEMQRARVRNDVGRGFFDTLAAQQAVVVHERLLKVALDADTNTHELARVGQADASDILMAEIAAEQAKVEFVTAQRMFLASFAQLATSAGQPALAAHPLSGRLVEPPELDTAEMITKNVQESPAVKQAQANVTVAEARVKNAKREAIPNLNVKAGEWYSGEDLGATNIRAGWMSFAEVGVQLPLWNRNQGNTAAARVELNRAQQDVTRTQLSTRNRAEPLAQQYQTARFTADRYRTEMLPRARRAYQLQVIKYQQMAQTYARVLTAQHMLFTLQLTYIQALNEEWRAAIALQNYTLMNALDPPTGVGTDATTINLPTSPGGSQ